MKIFFVSHSSVVYNYREKLRLLCRRRNVELMLFSPHFWPEAGKNVPATDRSGEEEGFQVVSSRVFLAGRVKRHFYPSFYPHAARFKPDIIHVEEEPYSIAAFQGMRAAQRLKSAFIFFTWENLLEEFPFPHSQIRRYVLNRADHAIAGNQEADLLLRKAGYPAPKISVIPQYGVNPNLFKKTNVSPLKKQLRLGSFTLGYAGRLVEEKGIYLLLEAAARLQKPEAHLLLVGNGPLRGRLEARAAQLGLKSRTHWVPAVDQGRMPEYLNCMDALVLPSVTTPRWKEQFGRVLIEAQACGVPVVGSDSGAIPEVIGPAGLIFKEGNVSSLLEHLERLASSPALRGKLGKQGRSRVLLHYSNQKLADQIYGIYERVLEERRPRKGR